MSFKRAQFDLDKNNERILTERNQFRDKINNLEDSCESKQNQLNEANREIATLKDEGHRLKHTIVNKDSENQRIEKFLELEKERR